MSIHDLDSLLAQINTKSKRSEDEVESRLATIEAIDELARSMSAADFKNMNIYREASADNSPSVSAAHSTGRVGADDSNRDRANSFFSVEPLPTNNVGHPTPPYEPPRPLQQYPFVRPVDSLAPQAPRDVSGEETTPQSSSVNSSVASSVSGVYTNAIVPPNQSYQNSTPHDSSSGASSLYNQHFNVSPNLGSMRPQRDSPAGSFGGNLLYNKPSSAPSTPATHTTRDDGSSLGGNLLYTPAPVSTPTAVSRTDTPPRIVSTNATAGLAALLSQPARPIPPAVGNGAEAAASPTTQRRGKMSQPSQMASASGNVLFTPPRAPPQRDEPSSAGNLLWSPPPAKPAPTITSVTVNVSTSREDISSAGNLLWSPAPAAAKAPPTREEPSNAGNLLWSPPAKQQPLTDRADVSSSGNLLWSPPAATAAPSRDEPSAAGNLLYSAPSSNANVAREEPSTTGNLLYSTPAVAAREDPSSTGNLLWTPAPAAPTAAPAKITTADRNSDSWQPPKPTPPASGSVTPKFNPFDSRGSSPVQRGRGATNPFISVVGDAHLQPLPTEAVGTAPSARGTEVSSAGNLLYSAPPAKPTPSASRTAPSTTGNLLYSAPASSSPPAAPKVAAMPVGTSPQASVSGFLRTSNQRLRRPSDPPLPSGSPVPMSPAISPRTRPNASVTASVAVTAAGSGLASAPSRSPPRVHSSTYSSPAAPQPRPVSTSGSHSPQLGSPQPPRRVAAPPQVASSPEEPLPGRLTNAALSASTSTNVSPQRLPPPPPPAAADRTPPPPVPRGDPILPPPADKPINTNQRTTLREAGATMRRATVISGEDELDRLLKQIIAPPPPSMRVPAPPPAATAAPPVAAAASPVPQPPSPRTVETLRDNIGTNPRLVIDGAVRRAVCASCQQPIAGQLVSVSGQQYHPDHFTCVTCRTPIGNMPFYELPRNVGFSCDSCYLRVHATRCHACQGVIQGEIISALGRKYHPEHFVCCRCQRPFPNDLFLERDGQPYCERDWSALFAPKCAGCSQEITGDFVRGCGSTWHPEHFVCAVCRMVLDSFHERDGKPYCRAHYYQQRGIICSACSKPTTGSTITAMQQKWHPECFVCASCKTPLNGPFFERAGKPICRSCGERSAY